MPEKDKKLIQRCGHGAAAVTVNSECVEVILFGGRKDVHLLGSLPIADPVVLRFGKYSCIMISNIIVYFNYNPRFTVLLIVNMYLLHDTTSDYVYSINWY